MTDAHIARVLVVDDEAVLTRALCDTLQDHGYDTVGCTEGRAALIALREQGPFDLLLADLMMPEMDGIALLRAAQATDSTLVAIIMTGNGTVTTAVEAMKAGALDYILKPFKLSAVLPVLTRALIVRQLRMDKAELEKSVREHVAQLKIANKELDAFTISVTHDLRAPLRAIVGFGAILNESSSESELSAAANDCVQQMIAGAKRMNQIIDNLLRLSQITRQPLITERVQVVELVTEVLQELRELDSDRRVDIRVGTLPDCDGDLALLKHVFVNLLSNAFKFTRHQLHPRIEVGCEVGGDTPVYFVRDNGAGFDVRYADKLFRPFQRLHSGEEFEGSGIGLSIVSRIVERHGGRIWAEAEKGKGAAFSFTLAHS